MAIGGAVATLCYVVVENTFLKRGIQLKEVFTIHESLYRFPRAFVTCQQLGALKPVCWTACARTHA